MRFIDFDRNRKRRSEPMRRWQIGCAFILCVVISQRFPAKLEAATSDARSPGQAEWESTLEAAKKEGLVIVAGPPGIYRRAPLVENFEKAFPGIKVEYTPVGGAQFVPRLKLERAAAHYLWDVHVGGTTSAITLIDEGCLAPIVPALILAQVKELKNWWLGKHHFADDLGRYIFAFQGASGSRIITNTNLVKPEEVKSYWDLLQPKWRGKLGITSPTHAGTGLAGATFFTCRRNSALNFLENF